MQGDCLGNDISNHYVTREECAALCTDEPMCAGWIYVVSGTKVWPTTKRPCYLKSLMCQEPIQEAGLNQISYYKIPDGKCVFLPFIGFLGSSGGTFLSAIS